MVALVVRSKMPALASCGLLACCLAAASPAGPRSQKAIAFVHGRVPSPIPVKNPLVCPSSPPSWRHFHLNSPNPYCEKQRSGFFLRHKSPKPFVSGVLSPLYARSTGDQRCSVRSSPAKRFMRTTSTGKLPDNPRLASVSSQPSTLGLLNRPSVPSLAYSTASSTSPSTWTVQLVPCLKDNYAYLIVHDGTKTAAVVDPSEARPVEQAVEALGVNLTHVLNTHHHWDHTGGNLDLKARYNAIVVGPAADKDRIPGIDVALQAGDVWELQGLAFHVHHTPGHTRGHCSFFVPDLGAVFTGDTLFSLGCGRLFEGTPTQMWSSLSSLASLPPETKIYCGHEYTQSNARFALTVEPGNPALQERVKEIDNLRAQGLPTIPTTIAQEAVTNPFLRPKSKEIRECMRLGDSSSDVDVFAAVRRAKDSF